MSPSGWTSTAFVVLATLSPLASAHGIPIGTEGQPELVDAPDNVQYSSLYTGAHDRTWVDLLAAWFKYEETNDTLRVTVKVVGLSRLQDQARDWGVEYLLDTNLTVDGITNARLSLAASKATQTDLLVHNVTIFQGDDKEIPVLHGFEAALTDPGYLRFWIPMTTLRQFGQAVRDPSIVADESYRPAGPRVLVPIVNLNQASSSGLFEFAGLSPPSPPSTEGTSTLTDSSTGTTTGTEGTTAGFLFASVLAATGIAVVLRRSR